MQWDTSSAAGARRSSRSQFSQGRRRSFKERLNRLSESSRDLLLFFWRRSEPATDDLTEAVLGHAYLSGHEALSLTSRDERSF